MTQQGRFKKDNKSPTSSSVADQKPLHGDEPAPVSDVALAVYRDLFNTVPEGLLILDARTGQIIDVNPGLTQMLQCGREAFLDRKAQDFLSMEDISEYHAAVENLREKGSICHRDIPFQTKDGHRINASFECHFFSSGSREYIRCLLSDADASKQTAKALQDAEAALRASEEQYRTILDIIDQCYYELDLTGRFTFVNDAQCRDLGYSRDELIGMHYRRYTSEDMIEKSKEIYKRIYSTGEPIKHYESAFVRKDGMKYYSEVSASLLRNTKGEPIGFRGLSRDMTERKRLVDAVAKSELKYRSIVENAQEGIFQVALDARRISANPALAAMLGYSSPEEMESSIFDISRQIYVNPGEFQQIKALISREGGIRGYETEFFRKDKSRIWVSMSISAVRDESDGLLYYHGIVEDITPKKKMEEERQDSIHRLRRSLGATINAMSATVEAKDPYTAGHQRRVADLARAIATDMKLNRDQIDGIRLAGMIHDIGKISVPSEILTKPTRLTELEFELIKTHSEAGYNILKDIDFPWPLARIVLEHHERMDGTGYPQKLTGDQILLESKIIAVADVVEAISSHRPYRPACGIEPALEEIAKNKGTLYDASVVEACLKLFSEGRYKMPC